MNPLAADQELAARVAAAADLLDVRMLSTECRLLTAALPERLGIGLEVVHETEPSPDEEALVVRIGFTVNITSADAPVVVEGAEPAVVAVMQATWAALYGLVDIGPGEMTADALVAFAETSSTLTVFPYAREYFTSMSNRLGLPKLVLPTFRVPSPWHPEEELP